MAASDGIVSGMLREADNSIMRVIGTGENHWPMIYDRDLADLYVKLVAHPDVAGIFHATDDGDERVIDLVKAMSRHVEHAGDPLHAAPRGPAGSGRTPTRWRSIRSCAARARGRSAGRRR